MKVDTTKWNRRLEIFTEYWAWPNMSLKTTDNIISSFHELLYLKDLALRITWLNCVKSCNFTWLHNKGPILGWSGSTPSRPWPLRGIDNAEGEQIGTALHLQLPVSYSLVTWDAVWKAGWGVAWEAECYPRWCPVFSLTLCHWKPVLVDERGANV